MSWKKVFLGSLYELPSRNGLTRPSKVRGVGYKMVNMGELFANEWLYDIPMERVQLNDREKRECLIAKNDLLFARQSLVASGAGKCSIVREVKEPTTFESHLIRVRLDTTKAVPLFYYYYFKSPLSPMKTIVTICAQAGIRGSDLATLSVECPDLPTQRRIASILSAYDDLIENNRRQIKLLEEAAQRLYREWFVELRFPGHEGVKVMDGVPEGWMKGTVDNIVKLLSGYPFKSSEYVSSGKYRLITIKNVKDGEFSPDNVDYIDQLPDKVPSHCILTEGDILLSLTGNIGRVCIVNGYNYLLNQRVAKLQTLHPAYAYCMFRSKEMLNKMTALSNGVAQQNLSLIRAEKIRILIPSSNLLFQFKNIVEPIISQIILLNNQITFACEARDRLLPELMDGEIEV